MLLDYVYGITRLCLQYDSTKFFICMLILFFISTYSYLCVVFEFYNYLWIKTSFQYLFRCLFRVQMHLKFYELIFLIVVFSNSNKFWSFTFSVFMIQQNFTEIAFSLLKYILISRHCSIKDSWLWSVEFFFIFWTKKNSSLLQTSLMLNPLFCIILWKRKRWRKK